MRKILPYCLILLVLAPVFLNQAVIGQDKPLNEEDKKYYQYSIDQLSKANEKLQAELAVKDSLIAQFRAEIRRLYTQIDAMKYQPAAVSPVTSVSSAPSQPKTKPVKETKSVSTEVPDDLQQLYNKALEEFKQKRYPKALELFQTLIERDRNHKLADNCQYWIGETYYATKDYQKALIEFEKVFSYASTNKDDDAQLKLGLCYIRMNDNASAKRELTRLLSNYPDSEYTELARRLLEKL
ncbi:tetratricopeptide repeat protein [bacterium]|nr:tetratricopeptide repeat protein [bacterium]